MIPYESLHVMVSPENDKSDQTGVDNEVKHNSSDEKLHSVIHKDPIIFQRTGRPAEWLTKKLCF